MDDIEFCGTPYPGKFGPRPGSRLVLVGLNGRLVVPAAQLPGAQLPGIRGIGM